MLHHITQFFWLSSKLSIVHGWFCQIYLLHTVDQIWGECYYKDIESDFWLEISLWKCPFLYFWYTSRNTFFHLCLKEHLMSSYISKIRLLLKYYQNTCRLQLPAVGNSCNYYHQKRISSPIQLPNVLGKGVLLPKFQHKNRYPFKIMQIWSRELFLGSK